MMRKSQHAFQEASPAPLAINLQSFLASLFDCEPDFHLPCVQFTHYELRLTQIVQGPILFVASPSKPVHVITICVHCAALPFQNHISTVNLVAQCPVSFGVASRTQTHLRLRLSSLISKRDCDTLLASSQTHR